MRNKLPINVLIIALSSFVISFSFDIRPEFNNRPWTGILVVFVAYLAAYLFVPLFSGKYEQILSVAPLIGISLLGSFIFSLYILSHTIIKGLINSSMTPASDFYVPTLIVFLKISTMFFVISAIILTVTKIIIKSVENPIG